MALEQITFNIAAFNDADAGGNNYFAGEIYEVFNTNDTLADIFSDAAGTNPINQDGISNKSNASGEVTFYINNGSYYIAVGGYRRDFQTNIKELDIINDTSQAYEFDTTLAMEESLITFPVNKVIKTKGGITVDDGKGSYYLVKAAQPVDGVGDRTLSDGKVALIKSHVSVETSTGTSEAALAIVVGDNTYDPKIIGEGSVLIGGYEEGKKNRLPGTTELRAIIAGYDCEIAERGVADDGGLACVIVGSHHSEIQGDATHTLIAGGSYNIVTDGDYNLILGGTANTLTNVRGRPNTSIVLGGNGNNVDGPNGLVIGGRTSRVEGEYSLILEGQDSVAEGNFVIVMGSKNESRKGTLGNGQKNTISGGRTNIIDSITSPQGNVIAGGDSNEIYGISCSIGGGITCVIGTPSVNATYAVIAGGLSNLVTAETAGTVVGGRDNHSSGDYSSVLGGRNNRASSIYSIALGYEAEARLDGFEAVANGAIAIRGDNQLLRGVRSTTTNDTTPGLTASLVMEDNSTWRFECSVLAHRVGASESASFKIVGLVRRDVGAGSVSFVGTPTVTNEFSSAGAETWTATVVTNTGSGAIRAEVTGEASKNINWCSSWLLTELIG